ncbi:hypothetical protein [Beggiatoa leptomitoformis]|uniref:Carboxymuconolactone decarboxylase-like domain-containing protein n=1 Tax=Beggiatoa leptomitoformis TaxID=288004 RepID=A0A2N9YG53_9GAMM|nr:hypothetical protein [Beggiatoa leptomitoformis]ALG68219.1 hypothetical protein AL038_11475 [Beggiatoa leptomitoformis]AUI69477.1 hypothetical protein BLE401_12800 [Beggiatoa leptomitoformis]
MSSKVFRDNVFPRHVSDLMSLMHMIVFEGTDGEERWTTYLTLEEKECVALGLAKYYQCEHCIEHHAKVIQKLGHVDEDTLNRNMNSLILFLRTDIERISDTERNRWIQAWQEYAMKIGMKRGDENIPHLIGLAVGIARDDSFLIQFCGDMVKKILLERGIEPRAAIGELESVVIFMKAASSKNRVASKIETLFN